MQESCVIAAALDRLGEMLEMQRNAIVMDDGDALPRISAQLHLLLTHLLAAPERARTEKERNRIAELRLRARINQHMLNRRQVITQQSLEVLGESSAVLQHARTMHTYAAAGGMARTPVRGRGFATA